MTVLDLSRAALDEELVRQIAREFPPDTRLSIPGMLTPEQYRHYLRLKAATRVRIRNNGATTGEVYGCKRHSGPSRIPGIHIKPVVHPFVTSYCVPIPFHGLVDGLHYLVGVSSNPTFTSRAATFLGPLPSLDQVWPSLADKVRPTTPGDDIYAFCIGLAEEISPAQAKLDEEEIARIGRKPIPRPRFI